MNDRQIPKPLLLLILDGWGYREETDANAINSAHKPTWDYLWQHYPHALIEGSGVCVGLPEGQMGNSEVGHLTMGSGRVIHQDLSRIDLAIEDKDFFHNTVLQEHLLKAKHSGKAVHLFGLLSPGGVHSHEKHWHALIEFANNLGVNHLYLHPFLDGRDTPPKSSLQSLKILDTVCRKHNLGKIVSIIGRYYAMDRDKRWDRIEQAYQLLAHGEAPFIANSVEDAIALAYARGETDEFVKATAIRQADEQPVTINDGDVIIFMNFRADRARELTHAFVDDHFDAFNRPNRIKLDGFVCLAEYDSRLNLPVAFPPESHENIFAEVVSKHHLKQLRIAETEKYAHVTFFFNGGIEVPFPGENRELIASPQVETYDLQPEMSAFELTDKLVSAITSETYDVIICNYANPDMVGHTGNFAATVKAIETIDASLSKIIKALELVDGEMIITADHGNAELMFDQQSNQPHTAHTSNLVPLIYFGHRATLVKNSGKLSDIAPTLLYLLNIAKPQNMTGNSLLSST